MPDGGYTHFQVPTPFVGRESQLRDLKTQLVNEQKRFVIVHGPPGMGKTALVAKFLQSPDFATWFPGGFLLLRGQDVAESKAAQVSFTNPPKDLLSIPGELRTLGRRKGSLVVIDDVTSDDQLEPFIPYVDEIQFLVTSRLNFSSRIAQLGQATWSRLPLTSFTNEEAEQLLVQILGNRLPTNKDVALLAQRVGNLPLAVRLIGALYLNPAYVGMPASEYLQELEFSQLLASEDRMARLFDRCLDLLGANEHAANLLLAALFFDPNDIPIDSLNCVADIPREHRRASFEAIMSIPILEYGVTRSSLRMHDLIHEVGNRSFEVREQYAPLRSRFVQLMLEKLLHASSDSDVSTVLPHIRRAIKYLLPEDIRSVADMMATGLSVSTLRLIQFALHGAASVGFWEAVLEHESSHSCENTSRIPAAVGQMELGRAHVHLGRLQDGKECLDKALEELGDDAASALLRARALDILGQISRADNRPRDAITHFDEAVVIYREHNADPSLLASTYRKLSRAYSTLGRFDEAHRMLVDALQIHEKADRTNDIAYDKCLLGSLYTVLGEYDRAERSLREAVHLHSRGSGRESAYVAYDLNRLGELQRIYRQPDAAMESLERALRLHERFYGSGSSNVALDKLRLGQALAANAEFERAEKLVAEASRLHSRIFGPDSGLCAYDQVVLAEILWKMERIQEARTAAKNAATILEARSERTIHLARTRSELGAVFSALGNDVASKRWLWQARRYYGSVGLTHEVHRIDECLLNTLFSLSSGDWSDSAQPYAAYLTRYSDSLFAKLGRAIVNKIRGHLLDTQENCQPWVVDLCCGSGTISSEIESLKLPVRVVGLDTRAMIREAQNSVATGIHPEARFLFRELRAGWAESLRGDVFKGESPKFITMSMSFFQFAPRERHLIFRSLAPLLTDGVTLLISTAAPDFEFPTDAAPGINETNPFKAHVFEAAQRFNLKLPLSLEDAVAPVFAKDTCESLGHFLWLYGFELSSNKLPVIEHLRGVHERVAFTRLKVISNKVFGKELPNDFWEYVLENTPVDYQDVIYGTVISARYRSALHSEHLFLNGSWDPANEDAPMRYASAAVIKNAEGQILMARRSESARDFRGSWSLPSSMSRPGCTLIESLGAALKRNLGLEGKQFVLKSVRLSSRTDAEGKKWAITMCLYSVRTEGVPRIGSAKYDSLRWVDDDRIRRAEGTAGAVGDCVASYQSVLAQQYTVLAG